MIFSVSHREGRGASPGVFATLGMLGALWLPLSAWGSPIGTEVITPEPDHLVLTREQTLAANAARAAAPVNLLSPAAVVQELRSLIELSRKTGSPRPLGLAIGLLEQLPQDRWTPDVYLMRATVHQRLHHFDQAEADLAQVLKVQPDNRQAWLTRYSIAMVRNDLAAARLACENLGQPGTSLLTESCNRELASFGANPAEAFRQLRLAFESAGRASAVERDYALVTLAEIATRLDQPEAGTYWQRALLQNPDDLYRRARYGDWLLAQGRHVKAAEITRGFNEVDTLAVLHAIALTRLNHPERDDLVAELEERFAEARWRGEFLHQWEYARFLLDVKGDATKAFEVATANWETQRSAPDRELLARAAASSGQTPVFDIPLQDRSRAL